MESTRSRLESTTSSLYFPGGWYSKAPENPTVHDHAQGEFIPSKPSSPVETKQVDPLGSQVVAMASEVESTQTTPVQVETQASAEEKKRWCIIM
jgi:hypothetical protein